MENLNKTGLRQQYFLTQVLKAKVFWQGKKIGWLADVLVIEKGKFPEVAYILVARPFGYEPLLVPIEKVTKMDAESVVVDIETKEAYEKKPPVEAIPLKDNILDKKVLDIEDREVEVVYDVRMNLQNDKLYVTAVDMSRYGFMRRMRLKWLADLIYRPKEKPNKEILSWTYIQPLPGDLSSFKGEVKLNILKEKLSDLPPQDLADILEEMDRGSRTIIFGQLDTEKASDALEEIDPSVQRELVSSLKQERVVQLICEMTPAQAADVLSVLPFEQAKQIIKLLPVGDSSKIQQIMDQQELKVSHFSTQDYITFLPDISVAKVEEEYPLASKGKDVKEYLYITSPEGKLLGIVGLKDVLLAHDDIILKDIMEDGFVALQPDETLKEASKMFIRYGHRALPVVDAEDRLLGVVLARDILNLKHRLV